MPVDLQVKLWQSGAFSSDNTARVPTQYWTSGLSEGLPGSQEKESSILFLFNLHP